jgi:hypothetical protein
MKAKVPQLWARLFGRAGESVTRSDRRERELGFERPFPPLTARPNRRRDDALLWTTESSPLGGAPKEPGRFVLTHDWAVKRVIVGLAAKDSRSSA